MIAIHGQTTVYCDVDDTIVLWAPTLEQKEKEGVLFTCPASQTMHEDGYLVKVEPWTTTLVPHKKHIEQLKAHKARGSTIVLWSAAGSEWAEIVAKTLGLEKIVDLCISKPMWVYDDLPVTEFMPKPQWFKDE